MPACLCHPSSLRADKNASLYTWRTIRCLKSHLRRLLSLCSSFLPPSFCPSGHLICQPRTSPSPAAAARPTDTFIVLLFLTLVLLHPTRSHLPPAHDTGVLGSLARRGLSSIVRLALQSLSSPHPCYPVTKEWLGPGGGTEPLL